MGIMSGSSSLLLSTMVVRRLTPLALRFRIFEGKATHAITFGNCRELRSGDFAEFEPAPSYYLLPIFPHGTRDII
jgi:hypothetical protein